MIPCWEIDQSGNIVEHYLMDNEEIQEARDEGKFIITKSWDNPFFKPKYDFTLDDWVEGLTQEEIDELKNNQPPPELTLEDLKRENEINALAIMELAEMLLG